ncbi:tetratricopeptide repeat protein [Sulfurimonas sp.]|nr:tetratricopeptide repeat protein [Sulfurimonas sp.]
MESKVIQKYFNKAVNFENKGNLLEAEKYYKKIMLLNKSIPAVYNNLGNIYKKQGFFEKAEKSFLYIFKIDQCFLEGYYNIGNLYYEYSMYEEALEYYTNVISLSSKHLGALNNMGLVYTKLKDYTLAIESYAKSIDIDDKQALVYSNLGNIFYDIGKFEDSIMYFKMAISLDSGNQKDYFNLANTLNALTYDNEAMNILEKAISIKSSYLDARVVMANLYWMYGNIDKCYEQVSYLLQYMQLRGYENQDKITRGFTVFLSKLIEYVQNNPSLYKQESLPHIVIIGDSHSLSYAHTVLKYKEEEYIVDARMIFGCKVWHLANNSQNRFKAHFKNLLMKIPDNCKVIFSIGEIDCRVDEGILPYCKKIGCDIERYIDDLVSSYIRYIVEAIKVKVIEVIIYGVPAPDNNNMELIRTIQLFNEKLQRNCKKYDFEFLNPYLITSDVYGKSNGIYHIENVHLKPSTLQEIVNNM